MVLIQALEAAASTRFVNFSAGEIVNILRP